MDYYFSKKVASLQASAIREILKYCVDPTVISFAAGNPSPDAFPQEEIRAISRNLLTDDAILALQYNITEGYTPLRNTLKKRLAEQGLFQEGRDDLIITSGAQQGNELACKVLCDEGDTLLCEAPSFIGSLNAFRSYHVNLVGVEMEQDGVNLEKLEDTLQKYEGSVRLAYFIPNFQNPTGRTMSLEKRKAVYELAEKYNFIILEDNPYGDLRFAGTDVPNIKSLDTEGRVIYTGSFSKVLAPGLRVGYVCGPKEILQKMIVCKQVSDVHTNIWAQVVCDKFLNNCDMDAHLNKLRDIYRRKCNLMVDGIQQHFSSAIQMEKPEGGLFIWCTLPEGSDMLGFCTKAVADYKIAVVPGTAFTIAENDTSNSFRLNFSTPTDEQLIRGTEILGRLTKELFGA